ncbi:DUF4123 domain-containing protein [Pseudomonas saxonica]|nr:DUF4123 domain-containing protein [Pseudomonas saxonica]
MYLDASEWSEHLRKKAQRLELAHLDVQIDGTLFSESQRASLAALEPPPLQALLFEQTPEHANKALGPLLVRLQLDIETHAQWLKTFTQQSYKKAGALNLLSRWEFPELAAHLRDCTQAQWSEGACTGILRYYDSRLFGTVSLMLDPSQRHYFHAPVIEWLWLSRDGRVRTVAGHPSAPGDIPSAVLSLSDEQMGYMQAWTLAEQWHLEQRASGRHGFTAFEDWLHVLFEGHLAAWRERVQDADREAFVQQWLATNTPRNMLDHGRS